MDRRTLLKLLAATPVMSYSHRGLGASPLRVVVVGAGIIGASIAYHLAKSGASVTVIDGEGPATHASRGTFAWVNATWAKQPRHYHSLNQEGLGNWKSLQQALNLSIRWQGSLEWFEDAKRQEKLVTQISEQARWGENARMVGAARLAELEPGIDFGGAQQAALSENDGALDPIAATGALLNAAQKLGATVIYPSLLTGIAVSDGRLTEAHTSSGSIKADRLVLATGAAPDTARRFAGIDIPQRSTPGVIAITTPMPRLFKRIIVAPGIHMHQRDDGRIVLGEQGGAPQTEAHSLRLAQRPYAFPEPAIAAEHAARMLEVARRFAPDIANAVSENVYIGWRPMPLDGHPVLGASPEQPDVYLAIMHSGVSLAPIVGQLASHELMTSTTVERLEEFRPGRAFERVKRY
jgi:glycine/D-amino acid oxidase-like deaminating enzyme